MVKLESPNSRPKMSEIIPDPIIEYYKRDVDITLLRENLKLSHEQRLLKLMEMQKLAKELRQAGDKAD